MKRVLSGLAALVLMGACASAAAPTHVPWVASFEEATKKAAASHQLVMLDFFAEG